MYVLCESSSSQTCGPFPCEEISRQDLLGWGQSCLGSFAGALQSAGVNLQGAIILSCPLLLPSRVNGSSPTVFAMQPCCLVIQLNTCGALPTVMFTIFHFDISIAVQSTGGHVRIAHRLRERPRSARFPRQQQQQRLTDGPGTANHRVGWLTNHFTLPC